MQQGPDHIRSRFYSLHPSLPQTPQATDAPPATQYLLSTPRRQAELAEGASRVPATDLNREFQDHIDTELWGNTPQPGTLTQGEASTYMMERLHRYSISKDYDENMWERYCEDFEGWTSRDFEIAARDIRRVFRDFLLEQGVFITTKQGLRISTTLAEAIALDAYHKWTDVELSRQLAGKGFNKGSRYHPKYQSNISRSQSPRATLEPTHRPPYQIPTRSIPQPALPTPAENFYMSR